jgi:hypothetical protein
MGRVQRLIALGKWGMAALTPGITVTCLQRQKVIRKEGRDTFTQK